MKEREQKKELIRNMAEMARGYFSSHDFDVYILPIYKKLSELIEEDESMIVELNKKIHNMLQAESAGGKDKV